MKIPVFSNYKAYRLLSRLTNDKIIIIHIDNLSDYEHTICS